MKSSEFPKWVYGGWCVVSWFLAVVYMAPSNPHPFLSMILFMSSGYCLREIIIP